MDSDQDISDQLRDLTEDMIAGARRLLPEGVSDGSDHPAARNLRSKEQLYSRILQETKKTGL